MKKITSVVFLLVLLATLVTATGCESAQDIDERIQEDVLTRGQETEPAYQVRYFLSRKAINQWLERVDTPNKLWYVYVHAPISGEIIGYYVSSTIPLSYGVSLSNPQQTIYDSVLAAPGLDGVYYSGVDQRAWFFFDAETGTLITTNMQISFMDQPLTIQAPQLKIQIN